MHRLKDYVDTPQYALGTTNIHSLAVERSHFAVQVYCRTYDDRYEVLRCVKKEDRYVVTEIIYTFGENPTHGFPEEGRL